MYIVEGMINLGLEDDGEWTSDFHKEVAKNVCLCNPNITDREHLMHNVGIINKIPQERIEKVTYNQLIELGCEL